MNTIFGVTFKMLSSMEINTIIKQYDFNMKYAEALVNDVTEAQMTLVPSAGFENHPAFTLGHLVTGSAGVAADLGAEFEIPENWTELFLRNGPGDPRIPEKDTTKYPTKQELLNELNRQHEKVKKLLLQIDKQELHKEIKWRFSSHMPATLDMLVFMLVNHEAMHLGQLAAWKRALGMPSGLNTL